MGATQSGIRSTRKGQFYRCYLVRCRLQEDAGQPDESGRGGQPAREPDARSAGAWRFTVEQVRPEAARRSFASINEVAAYIDAELTSCSARQDSYRSTHSEVEP